MKQDDLTRISMLDVDSDLETGGLGGSTKLQQVRQPVTSACVEGLRRWNRINDDQLGIVGAGQRECLRERGAARLADIDSTGTRENRFMIESPSLDGRLCWAHPPFTRASDGPATELATR